VTVTLPALPSLVHERSAAAAPCSTPQRFVAYFIPNGMHMSRWVPAQQGSGGEWQLSPLLASLSDLKSELLVVSGLDNGQKRREFGDHAIGCGAFLTARKPAKLVQHTSSSVDQVLADAIGGCTNVRSLNLGTHNVGPEDVFGTYYTRSISWRGPRQALPDGKVAYPAGPATPLYKTIDPQAAFDRLFTGANTADSAQDARARRALRKSVLDAVAAYQDPLRQRLDAGDRHKLDQLFTGIRELERQLQSAPASSACKPGARPAAALGTEERIDVMGRIIALALQCDITRVVTFMLGDALNDRDLSFIPDVVRLGGSANDHAISHWPVAPETVRERDKNKYIATCQWKIARLGKLLRALDAVKDVDGQSLLHNTLVMCGSDVSDGAAHNHDDKPLLVAGRLGGRIRTDRHLRYSRSLGKPLGEFYIGLLALYGVRVDAFGNDGKEALSWWT
jgi:hypothetical protein